MFECKNNIRLSKGEFKSKLVLQLHYSDLKEILIAGDQIIALTSTFIDWIEDYFVKEYGAFEVKSDTFLELLKENAYTDSPEILQLYRNIIVDFSGNGKIKLKDFIEELKNYYAYEDSDLYVWLTVIGAMNAYISDESKKE